MSTEDRSAARLSDHAAWKQHKHRPLRRASEIARRFPATEWQPGARRRALGGDWQALSLVSRHGTVHSNKGVNLTARYERCRLRPERYAKRRGR